MAEQTHFDLKTIAIGCVYLLTNKATLYFPSSNRSSPSSRVVVDVANRPLFQPSDRAYFPFYVYWGAWHEAVLPVLENKDVQIIVRDNPSLRVHLNKVVIDQGQYLTLVDKIQEYLTASFVAAGLLPGEFAPQVLEALPEVVVPEGEPVVMNPGGPVGPDVNELLWPDGTPKLTYNIVDDE